MVTKNFIKQCEKAKEIQKLWKPKDGDYFYGYEWSDMAWKDRDLETKNISDLAIKEIHLLYFSGDDFDSCFPMGEEIGQGKNKPDLTRSFWLPTQEQLQEMVKDSLFYISGSYKNIYASASTGKRDGHVVIKKAKSWNELWLIFVMKEKYHKKWLSKEQEWVKGE